MSLFIIIFSIQSVACDGKGYGDNGGKIKSGKRSTASIYEHAIYHLRRMKYFSKNTQWIHSTLLKKTNKQRMIIKYSRIKSHNVMSFSLDHESLSAGLQQSNARQTLCVWIGHSEAWDFYVHTARLHCQATTKRFPVKIYSVQSNMAKSPRGRHTQNHYGSLAKKFRKSNHDFDNWLQRANNNARLLKLQKSWPKFLKWQDSIWSPNR